MANAVVFGGLGFIGQHFASHILEIGLVDHVFLADKGSLTTAPSIPNSQQFLDQGKTSVVECDVRKEIEIEVSDIAVIANFAAVHREPGHEDWEYFETNLKGAENVCKWAEKAGCENIVFTSSISPYGPTESIKNEESLPVPQTAYGSSKLAAEKIHIGWQKGGDNRKLTIVRPGVVFGPGEGGNVSRLIKAVHKRYFFYMGNKDTRKAGTYVKELCNALTWVMSRQSVSGSGVMLFNMSMNPGPSMKEYVDAICAVADIRRHIVSVPYFILYPMSFLVQGLAGLLRIDQPISPVRIKKLVRSNNILPSFLVDNGYEYKYTLESAFEDWMKDRPDEWIRGSWGE